LIQAQFFTGGKQSFSKGAGWGPRIVSEKQDNFWQVVNLWRGCVAFPVVNSRFGYADLSCNISLIKSQIKAFLSDVVTDSL